MLHVSADFWAGYNLWKGEKMSGVGRIADCSPQVTLAVHFNRRGYIYFAKPLTDHTADKRKDGVARTAVTLHNWNKWQLMFSKQLRSSIVDRSICLCFFAQSASGEDTRDIEPAVCVLYLRKYLTDLIELWCLKSFLNVAVRVSKSITSPALYTIQINILSVSLESHPTKSVSRK